MNKSFIIFPIYFVFVIFLIQFATGGLTASSENYSVARFETGIASSDSLSESYTALSISEYEGTTRNAENGVHILNVGFFNNTVYYVTVSIGSYSIYPESAVNGSIIQFSVSALNYQSIWAVLTLPNSTQETISMKNNEYSYYVANQIGTYNITFYANSSRGNLASVIDSFEITYPVVPPTPPSGGGGTKIIIEECTYIWDCTSWSICLDKVQERTCTNLGNCTGIEGKPLEVRECSDALFDVVMRLNDLEITQNETLNFSINLTETKGIEKIDVQIRYSIIDSNNTEIFSQIETRAIEGNLTYVKEISEVSLGAGEYILRVDILYGNTQRAFAEQGFEIAKTETGETEIQEKWNLLSFLEELNYANIILLVFCLLILSSIIIVLKKLRKRNYNYLIENNLKEGAIAIRSKEIAKARSIYENLRKMYNPKKDSKGKVYNRIKEFYNNILKSNFK